jgi:putative transcriptional regulator
MQPCLLIASPQMRDPYFERTVVLVWHHDANGAIGVVVNRVLDHTLAEVLDHVEEGLDGRSDVPVVWGGPVESGTGTVVTSGVIRPDEGWVVGRGLSVTRSQDALLRLLREKTPLMLCLGYAGWGPGQLDREIERGGWLWTDCDQSVVFDTPADQRYDRALETLGLTAGMVWMNPVDE